MSGKRKRPVGSNRSTISGAGPHSSAKRQRRRSTLLEIQELENRTLLSVTASLLSGVLEVDLSAAHDQAFMTPVGSDIQVTGTDFTTQSFSGFSSIVVQGTNTSSHDDPDQGVVFEQGAINLNAPAGTDALKVSGVTSVSFDHVAIEATSGDVEVQASETTSATGAVATSNPLVSVSLTGSSIVADNITLGAKASANYEYVAPLGGLLNDAGIAIAIAELDPSATVSIAGAWISASGDVTIAADTSATVNATTTVGTDLLGNALDPVSAAIAVSVVDSSAVSRVSDGSNVSAGAGSGKLSITSINTTEVTTVVDGSAAIGGVSAAVTLDNSNSQAFVDGGSFASAGTIEVKATTTNTATTSAKSTSTGGGKNAAIQNILGGKVNPTYLKTATTPPPDPAKETSAATTPSSGGLPLSIAGAVAVTKFTPTTQAYIDSSTATAAHSISVSASATNKTSTVADGSGTTSDAQNGVGVGVAINDAVVRNSAMINGSTGATTLSAPTIVVQSATPAGSDSSPNMLDASVSATAGTSGSNVGVAGSLALNIVSNTNEAFVPSGSTVWAGGDVTFNASDSAIETSTASAARKTGPSGGSGTLGVGASVALNIVDNTTRAGLEDRAQLTGAHNLTFTADSTDVVSTNAVAGSSGGGTVALTPSVGLSLVDNTTEAQVGRRTTRTTRSWSAARSRRPRPTSVEHRPRPGQAPAEGAKSRRASRSPWRSRTTRRRPRRTARSTPEAVV